MRWPRTSFGGLRAESARLKLRDQKESKWNADNAFYWRFALQGREVPPDTEKQAAGFYERGEYDRAEAAFRLLVECFDGYAEGYNYLGLIALEKRRLDDAINHFEKDDRAGAQTVSCADQQEAVLERPRHAALHARPAKSGVDAEQGRPVRRGTGALRPARPRLRDSQSWVEPDGAGCIMEGHGMAKGSWKNIEFLIDGYGEVTLGRVGPIRCAAIASDEDQMLAALVRRPGEELAELLARLDHAIDRAWNAEEYLDEINAPPEEPRDRSDARSRSRQSRRRG